jgi:hypothetical protein
MFVCTMFAAVHCVVPGLQSPAHFPLTHAVVVQGTCGWFLPASSHL